MIMPMMIARVLLLLVHEELQARGVTVVAAPPADVPFLKSTWDMRPADMMMTIDDYRDRFLRLVAFQLAESLEKIGSVISSAPVEHPGSCVSENFRGLHIAVGSEHGKLWARVNCGRPQEDKAAA